jgi:hypothetical protein
MRADVFQDLLLTDEIFSKNLQLTHIFKQNYRVFQPS